MKPICVALVACLGLLFGLSGVQAHRSLFASLQSPATSQSDNSTGDLFVVTAQTATLKTTGNQGTLQLDGLSPTTTWFADKPARRGGLIATTFFLGSAFQQDGDWMDNPNVALYSSGAAPGTDNDTVVSIALLSDPVVTTTTAGTSVLFSKVAVLPNAGSDANSVGQYYASRAQQGITKGPQFVNATQSTSTVMANVALFVDPYYCGCGCGGDCGCEWHDTQCLH